MQMSDCNLADADCTQLPMSASWHAADSFLASVLRSGFNLKDGTQLPKSAFLHAAGTNITSLLVSGFNLKDDPPNHEVG